MLVLFLISSCPFISGLGRRFICSVLLSNIPSGKIRGKLHCTRYVLQICAASSRSDTVRLTQFNLHSFIFPSVILASTVVLRYLMRPFSRQLQPVFAVSTQMISFISYESFGKKNENSDSALAMNTSIKPLLYRQKFVDVRLQT